MEGVASAAALIAKIATTLLPPILPIATETRAAIFQLGSYRGVAEHLAGLAWDAEDLPAASGAIGSWHPDGSYTGPHEMVGAMTLFGVMPRPLPPSTLIILQLGIKQA